MIRIAHRIGSKLHKTITRHAIAALGCAGFLAVLAGLGIWTHTVYAAKVRAEKAARKQEATLNQVMAKLNRMESEMQQQSQTMEAKLNALKYANAKLAAYALRTAARADARSARVEQAVALAPSPMGGGSGIVKTKQTNLEASICGRLDFAADAKLDGSLKLDAEGEAGVGADVAGDGAKARLQVKPEGDFGVGASFGDGLGLDVCYKIDNLPIPVGIDTSTLDSTVQTDSQQVFSKVSAFIANHPQLTGNALPNALDALNNFKPNFSRQSLINSVEDPSQTLASLAPLAQSLPLPGNLSNMLSSPTDFLPRPSNLTPEDLCGSAAAQGTGILSVLCPKVPAALESLDNVTTFLNGFSSVNLSSLQTKVTNVATDLTNVCHNLNGGFGTLKNAGLTIQNGSLGGIRVVTGVSPTYTKVVGITVIDGVTPDYTTYGIPLQTRSLYPFNNLPNVNCPTL